MWFAPKVGVVKYVVGQAGVNDTLTMASGSIGSETYPQASGLTTSVTTPFYEVALAPVTSRAAFQTANRVFELTNIALEFNFKTLRNTH
jgi:hypothetical protein